MKDIIYRLIAASLASLCIFTSISCDEQVGDFASREIITAPNLYGETYPPEERQTAPPETTPTGETVAVTEPPAPPVPKDTKVSFLACGDNLVHSNVYEDAYARGNGKYEFIHMYDDVADMIAAADLAYVNQEGPMAGASYGYSGYPLFNAPQEMGDTLVELGFDVINVANNHMLDQREAGLLSTIEFFKSRPITLIGGYLNKEDYDDVRVVTVNDIKIAFLSYTYGTNGLYLPAGSETVIPLLDETDMKRQTEIAKERADIVIASLHWGNEDWFEPSESQLYYEKVLVDCGVDVILGMHSHTLQPIKWDEREDGHKTLCIYSIGNFISTMLYARNMVGGMLTFDIVRRNGEYLIEKPLLYPTVCYYNTSRRGLQVYRMENFTDAMASTHGSQRYGAFDVSRLRRYVTDTISGEFLPDWIKS